MSTDLERRLRDHFADRARDERLGGDDTEAGLARVLDRTEPPHRHADGVRRLGSRRLLVAAGVVALLVVGAALLAGSDGAEYPVTSGGASAPEWTSEAVRDPEVFAGRELRGMTVWDDRLVAWSYDGGLWVAGDGLDWREVAVGGQPNAITGAAVWRDMLVVLERRMTDDGESQLAVAATADLEAWQLHPVEGLPSEDAAAWAGTQQLAVSGDTVVVTAEHSLEPDATDRNVAVLASTDLVGWEPPADPELFAGAASHLADGRLRAVGDRFVLTGALHEDRGPSAPPALTPAIFTSADGRSWTRTLLDGHGAVTDVTAAGTGLLAVGRSAPTDARLPDSRVWSSADGVTWTELPPAPAVVTFVGAGDDGAVHGVDPLAGEPGGPAGFGVWTTTDHGKSWTRTSGRHRGSPLLAERRGQALLLTAGDPILRLWTWGDVERAAHRADGGDLEAWCALSAELDGPGTSPTDEQYDRLVTTAPGPIAGDVAEAVAILRQEGDTALGTPELETRLDRIFDFEARACPPR